jgi:hypothetical protein
MIERWIEDWLREPELAGGGLCLECRYLVAAGERCHADQVLPWSGGQLAAEIRRIGLGEAKTAASDTWTREGSLLGVLGAVGAVAALATGTVGLALVAGGLIAGGGFFLRHAYRDSRLRRALHEASFPLAVNPRAGLPEQPLVYGTIGGRAGGAAAAAEVAVEQLIRPVWVGDDGPVIARLGLTRGFTVTLDDGRVAALAPGRVRIVDRCRRSSRVDVELPHPEVVARLDRVAARVGDRVGLQAELAVHADHSASYRDAPSHSYVVTGAAPVVHLLPPASPPPT